MNTITFDPDKHLNRSDQERLAEAAEQAGMEVADFIEALIKKALFATILTSEPKEAA